jgi:hypothetical protein
MRVINRSGKLDEFKALPATSSFLISTGKAGILPDIRNLDDLYEQGVEKLNEVQDYENSLSIPDYLA